MRYSCIVSFSLLLDLVFHTDSAPPDVFAKNWLDGCDIKRLKLMPQQTTTQVIKTTRKPFPPLIPGMHQPSHGGKMHIVNNHPMVDVSAKLEKLIKALKDKLILDALERGADPEVDPVNPNVRGFESNLYHDMYDDEGRDYANVAGGSGEGYGGGENEPQYAEKTYPDSHHPDSHHPGCHHPDPHYPGCHHPDPHYPDCHHPDPHHPGCHHPDPHYPDCHHPGPHHPGCHHPGPPHPGPTPNFDHIHPGDTLQDKKRRKMRGR